MERVPLAEKFFSNIINPILDRLLLASRLLYVRAERTIRRRRRTLDGNEKSGVFERGRRSSVATTRRILRKPNIKENVGKKHRKHRKTETTTFDGARRTGGVERGKSKCALLSEAIIAGLKSLKKLRRTSYFANITPTWAKKLGDTANGSSARI